MATSEAVPFAKTGGLADVTGSLCKEFGKMPGIEVFLVLPLYRTVRERFDLVDTGLRMSIPAGARSYACGVRSYGPSVYFLECDEFFDRPELYGTPLGDYPDNAARFVFFGRAVLEACTALGLRPDVVHCNDWQTGLIPLYLKTLYRNDFFRATASILTIHNLGYQGLFGPEDFPLTGLGREWFTPEGVEFYGKVNFLKAGIISAGFITTVSGAYAREILTPDFGHGLDGVLRKRADDLYGIVNGIDLDEWDPGRDPFIPAGYGASNLRGKAVCKKKLMEECSLDRCDKETPVISLVGRLSEQKGLDIFLDSVDEILSWGAGLIVLGKGDEPLQSRVRAIAQRYPGRACVKIGYDESLAHRIYAGSDLFLMPSRYEPCGLGQMIAMRYGTIPVAGKTGGLSDTIADHNPLKGEGTGFLFEEHRAASLRECLKRALSVFVDNRRWRRMVARSMEMDFSWKISAQKYTALYAKTLEGRDVGGDDDQV